MQDLGNSILHFLLYALGVALVALPVGLIRKHNAQKKAAEAAENTVTEAEEKSDA